MEYAKWPHQDPIGLERKTATLREVALHPPKKLIVPWRTIISRGTTRPLANVVAVEPEKTGLPDNGKKNKK